MLRNCLLLQVRHTNCVTSSDRNAFDLVSVGVSSRPSTFLVFSTGFEGDDELRDVLRLAEADVGLVVASAGSGGGCDAVAGAGDCTCGAGVFGTSILG